MRGSEVFSHGTFTYDGDGKRVKSVLTTNVGTTTTYFVSTHYEVTHAGAGQANGVVTKYYYAGSQRIAMRQDGDLFFIIGDHLGSTSIVTNANGTKVSEMRYKAWGEVRYESGATPTGYTYTGQYSYTADFGLMFYREASRSDSEVDNARWYDPGINQFTSPDTLIPNPYNSLDYNRYGYARYNPLRYTDPTGHVTCEGDNYDDGPQCVKKNPSAYNPRTLDDFRNMSWRNRKDWLQSFAIRNGLENWFDDMAGAIDFMTSDSHLSAKGGITEVMDAAVLQAVNDGWLIHTGQDPVGGGGQGWDDFFDAYELFNRREGGISEDQLISIRLKAEQYGVDYSWRLGEVQGAYNNSDPLDQIYFDIFKGGADSYRSLAVAFRGNPLAVNAAEYSGSGLALMATDPRTSGPFLHFIGQGGYPFALFLSGHARTPISSYP